ncbi:MAG: DUF1214 domain-containing protein [Pseudomonadota bacterium]
MIAILAGAAVGVATAYWAVDGFGDHGAPTRAYSVGNGVWSGDLAVGSAAANPFTRARIAKRGLLALSREEAIYFFRDRDENGERFRGDCIYKMSGGALPAEWWSVTLYDDDDFLTQNDDNAHSINSFTLADANADWSAMIGSTDQRADALWLSTRNAGAFSLTLRLYQPYREALDNPNAIAYPSIERLHCMGGTK